LQNPRINLIKSLVFLAQIPENELAKTKSGSKQMTQKQIRLAKHSDIPHIEQLIQASVSGLNSHDYTSAEVASALKYIFGVDTQLLDDGTYYVIEADRVIIASGGWSKRSTLFGGDQMKGTEDNLLNPQHESARIRAFYVHPDWARQGLGSWLMQTCEDAAKNQEFNTLELVATRTGIPLYEKSGFKAVELVQSKTPDDEILEFTRMRKSIVS
jgi:N-acetylglutamate synthase-like GNAT family acetyltransferase